VVIGFGVKTGWRKTPSDIAISCMNPQDMQRPIIGAFRDLLPRFYSALVFLEDSLTRHE